MTAILQTIFDFIVHLVTSTIADLRSLFHFILALPSSLMSALGELWNSLSAFLAPTTNSLHTFLGLIVTFITIVYFVVLLIGAYRVIRKCKFLGLGALAVGIGTSIISVAALCIILGEGEDKAEGIYQLLAIGCGLILVSPVGMSFCGSSDPVRFPRYMETDCHGTIDLHSSDWRREGDTLVNRYNDLSISKDSTGSWRISDDSVGYSSEYGHYKFRDD